jgi:ATP-dependent Lon protease
VEALNTPTIRRLTLSCRHQLSALAHLISIDPLSPGTVYTAGVTSDGTVGLYRVEVSVSSGTGKLKTAGGVSGAMKESIQRAFSYVQAKKIELGIARDLDTSDLHVEAIDLLGNRVEAEVGVAFFVASYSVLRKTRSARLYSSSAT